MTKKKTLYIYNTNASDDGTHRIHEYVCSYTPENANNITLDFFKTYEEALEFAKANYDYEFSSCDHCTGNKD